MRALAAFLLLAAAASLPAVIIDRIAITVGNQAITEGQITQDLELTALLNRVSPVDNPDTRRQAAGRLIEQALIRREMTFGSYPPVPPAEIDAAYASTEKAHGSASGLAAALAQYELTTADLRNYLQWQLALLKFIDLRFRPAVQVTSDDVQKYYRENVLAQPGKNGSVPSLQQLHDQIEQKLTGERVDAQVNEWIKRARARTAIHYLDSALGTNPPAPLEQSTVQPH